MKRGWFWVALAVLPTALGGCLEAETLGDAPFDEVPVGTPPAWNNGIGELMQLKCGVCHAVPPNPVSPDFIPNDLDLNFQFPPGAGIRGAVDILPFIAAGLLRANGGSSGTPQMPWPYATPLTTAERNALETWDGS